jgi:hypothetical protein
MGFSPEIRDDFVFVTYELPRLPSADSIRDVAAWMIDRGLVDAAPPYDELCTPVAIEGVE